VYRQSRYIDQIVVIGNDRPHLVALVVANQAAVDKVKSGGSAHDVIEQELEILGRQLSRHEQVRAFAVIPEPFSIERGELTATLKLRRDRIEARYLTMIDGMFQEWRPEAMA